MSDAAVAIVAVVVLAIVAVAVWLLWTRRRRQELRDRFGSEYERVVEDTGTERAADRELIDRAKRHEQLRIRPISRDRLEEFTSAWRTAQARFVDDPSGALEQADRLLEEVMVERGYPIGDFEQRTADLSVEHAKVLEHYRHAHDVALADADGRATTEELRQGFVHYRALFSELLDTGDRTNMRRPA
jgi:hypothetical protein